MKAKTKAKTKAKAKAIPSSAARRLDAAKMQYEGKREKLRKQWRSSRIDGKSCFAIILKMVRLRASYLKALETIAGGAK